MAKTRSKPASATAVTDVADKRLALAAVEKQRRGEIPSRDERAALKRYEKARDEDLRREHFSAIRKAEWRAWSGRQDKVLNDQAARYGIPIGGATIDLPTVVRWWHDFLAERDLRPRGDEEGGEPEEALERLRNEKWLLARIERQRQEGEVLDRTATREALLRMAAILRRLGETMARQHGAEAHRLVDEALDNWGREMEILFVEHDADDNKPQEPASDA